MSTSNYTNNLSKDVDWLYLMNAAILILGNLANKKGINESQNKSAIVRSSINHRMFGIEIQIGVDSPLFFRDLIG